ncbi:MAG TPA: hypothetical protein VNZ03_29420 [Terriglobales bacterium]|jgi:hypothetical protein|nr:hypothetical protein [Terriglobales bacterium]
MRKKLFSAGLLVGALLAGSRLTWPQNVKQNLIFIVSGQPGQAPIFQINGRSYVDIEEVARLTNGSLGFQADQVTLKLPPAAAGLSSTNVTAAQPAGSEFSTEFLKAGIEEMAVIREWRSGLINALQNGYPVTDQFVSGHQSQAATNLRLASVAVSTDSDRSAFQLLSNEFDNIQKLSNKIRAARKNMNYISPDALKGNPLDQQILSCARSLAAMAASGQFHDDGSCN